MEPENHEHQSQHPTRNPDETPAPSALESAACYVAASPGAGPVGDGSGQAFSASFEALVEWAVENGLIRPEADFPFFTRATDGHGDEHEAWFDETLEKWYKATYLNRFGLAWGRDGTATALEYLSRLVLQNIYFGDDLQLIAIVNSSGKVRILTSQPHIAGNPATYEQIQDWFLGLGFCRLSIGERIAWYRIRENLLVADAHEGNVIRTDSGELVPIDLNIIQPVGELRVWALANAEPNPSTC